MLYNYFSEIHLGVAPPWIITLQRLRTVPRSIKTHRCTLTHGLRNKDLSKTPLVAFYLDHSLTTHSLSKLWPQAALWALASVFRSHANAFLLIVSSDKDGHPFFTLPTFERYRPILLPLNLGWLAWLTGCGGSDALGTLRLDHKKFYNVHLHFLE